MKSRVLAILSVLVGLLAISGPVLAHHGAARWNTEEWEHHGQGPGLDPQHI